jgi:hypothetical protein
MSDGSNPGDYLSDRRPNTGIIRGVTNTTFEDYCFRRS